MTLEERFREILLNMFQSIEFDYNEKTDRFTGLVTLPDKPLDQAISEIKKAVVEGGYIKLSDLDATYKMPPKKSYRVKITPIDDMKERIE